MGGGGGWAQAHFLGKSEFSRLFAAIGAGCRHCRLWSKYWGSVIVYVFIFLREVLLFPNLGAGGGRRGGRRVAGG
jgi:hypothetical protein